MNYFTLPGMIDLEIRKDHEKIISAVAQHFELDLFKKTRVQEYVFARYLCMYLINNYAGLTLKRTGELFNKDHTTVIHAKDCIENYIYTRSRYHCYHIVELHQKIGVCIPKRLMFAVDCNLVAIK